MYLQTVMLLLRAEGLHSCPQMAWAKYHKTVSEILEPPGELSFSSAACRSDSRTSRRRPLARTGPSQQRRSLFVDAPLTQTGGAVPHRSTACVTPVRFACHWSGTTDALCRREELSDGRARC